MTTAERLARNNALFREANEEIRAKAESYGSDMPLIPFLCECARKDCHQLVPISLMEYGDIRSKQCHFLIAQGHEAEEGPSAVVVRQGETYVVVEKGGEVREALERDPI